MDKKRRLIILLGVLGCYFIFGYYDSARGATLSQLMAEYSWNYDTGGWLALLYYLGYLLSTLFGGMLSDRYPKKLCLAAAGGLLAAVTFGYTAGGPVLFAAVFFFGIALGVIEVAGNGMVVELYPPKQRGRYLNLVAGMHSIGAVLAPAVCGAAALRLGWRAAFFLILPVIGVSVAVLAVGKMSDQRFSQPSHFGRKAFAQALACRSLYKFYALAFLYIAAESTVISWMVSFLTEERKIGLTTASAALSCFFLLIGTGRFLGGVLLTKISIFWILSVGYPLAVFGLIGGAVLPDMWWLLPVSGLFFSVLLPTSLAAMSNACKTDTGISIGIFFACGAAGGIVGSWAAGQVSEAFGVHFGILLAALFLLGGTVIAVHAAIRANREKRVGF